MPDDQTDDQHPEVAMALEADTGTGAVAARPATRTVRRPRPAPSPAYVPGRRSRAAEPGMNSLVVPLIAVVALLALILAVLFDHFHNNGTSTPAAAPIPTLAPTATVAPTVTPVALPAMATSKAGEAAEVNSEVIPLDFYQGLVRVQAISIQRGHQDPTTGQPVPGMDPLTGAGKKQLDTYKSSSMRQLVDTALAVAYAKQHNLVATPKQVATQLSGIESQQGGAAAFEKQVLSAGYTMAMVNKIIADGTTFTNVGNAVTKDAGCPCDVHARHILLAAKDHALAVKLAKEVQANQGKTFAELAKKYSTDTSNKNQGGDLGFFSKGQMVAPFEKVALSLKINQVSDPVKTQFGWHIIQVLGTRPSQATKQAAFQKWLKAQKATAVIHTYIQLPK